MSSGCSSCQGQRSEQNALRRQWNGGSRNLEVIEEAVGSADVEAFLGEWDVDADADEGVAIAAVG